MGVAAFLMTLLAGLALMGLGALFGRAWAGC